MKTGGKKKEKNDIACLGTYESFTAVIPTPTPLSIALSHFANLHSIAHASQAQDEREEKEI